MQRGDITCVVVSTVSEDGNRSQGREQGPGSRPGFAARVRGTQILPRTAGNPECLGVERRAGRGEEGGEKNDGEEVKRVSSLDLNEVGEAADFAIEDAELALDFLDLEFEGMSFAGSFGDEGLHGGTNEFRDAARTVGRVALFQGIEFALGKAQADGPAFADADWHKGFTK